MRKLRGKRGFTLAELLVVIAIIAILGGVSALVYTNTQRNLAQNECDTTAKEIFIAVQNHLALAKSQNYLGVTDYGEEGTLDEDSSGEDTLVYYIVNKDSTDYNDMLEQLLPFGAIDETIRAGGSYLIRYQPDTAMVLDVFYCKPASQQYGHALQTGEYTSLMENCKGEGNISNRRNYFGDHAVVGWFGGESPVASGGNLTAPTIEVENAERLLVKVTDPNIKSSDEKITNLKPLLKLLISNESRTAECAITLTDVEGESVRPFEVSLAGQSRLYERSGDPSASGAITYTIVLDDITKSGMHFADLVSGKMVDSVLPDVVWKDEKRITPGENIYIRAVAYSNKALSNVAYSGEWLTNSLFAELRQESAKEKESDPTSVALIDNIRHLENLSTAISGCDNKDSEDKARFDTARQTADLDWSDFKSKINKEKPEEVCVYDSEGNATKPGCFLPVSPSYALKYNGQTSVTTSTGEEEKTVITNHTIEGIVVDDAEGDAEITGGGVFGKLKDATIENLELIDCSVTVAGSGIPAGTLAGELEACIVTNVLSHNSAAFEEALAKEDATRTTVSAAGDAGGLAGAIEGNCEIERCAAALIIKSTAGSAGGLIGSSAGGTVTACYSGGHTIDDTVTGAVKYHESAFNVTAESDKAGGLIGDAGDTKIENCYSTCSAKGGTAGGLVGTSSGSIDNSYCTGLVSKAEESGKAGAFAGEYSGSTPANCLYFEIVNEIGPDTDGVISYLPPVDGKESMSGITALDASAQTYEAFCGPDSDWKDAVPYDAETLNHYYGQGTTEGTVRYNLKTVERLKTGETEEGDFVAVHYGDWPVPEIFVLNTK